MTKVSISQERIKLKNARMARGLSQPALANEIKCSREAISQWERGVADPHPDYILALCTFFGKNPADLDLAKELTEDELRMIEEILKNRTVDRRQALGILTLPAFASVDLSSLSKPLVSPEQFLGQCNAAINACWQLMKHGNFGDVQSVLVEYLPTLADLTSRQSEYQSMAASQASQAKILQAQLAGHKLDYIARRIYSTEAMHLGELSGDSRIYATALYWQADTFIYYYHQPQKAIHIIKDALALLDSDAFLLKSALSFNLAIAYAIDKGEKDKDKIIDMAQQARIAMPKSPELEPFHQCVDIGPSGLDRYEGRTFLYLAERFSDQEYAEKAYNAFGLAINKQEGNRTLCQTLIHQADAARVIGDLHEFATCLERGLTIALQIGSQKRKDKAYKVLCKVSELWKKEQEYQNLVKMF